MKQIHTYQQGDPEWLIIQKQYHELLPEERDSLKEWINSPEEYDRMRNVLLELHDDQEEWLEPDAAIKKNLMRKFVTEDKGGRLIWLNSIFFSQGQAWYKQPVVKYGLAAACMIGLAVFFFQPTRDIAPTTEMAAEKNNGQIENSNVEIADAESKAADTLRQFAEVKPEMPLPPAPVSVLSEMSVSQDSDALPEVAKAESPLDAVAESYAEEAISIEGKEIRTSDAGSTIAEMNVSKDLANAPSTQSAAPLKKSEVGGATPIVNAKLSVNFAEVSHLFDGLYTAR